MKLAIVGAKGSGKSTLFRAFTGADATPVGGNAGPVVAVVKVRDPRLEWLRDKYQPKKYTPVAVEVQDFPALPDRAEIEGMKLSEMLAALREAEGLIICVRGFEDPTYPHAALLRIRAAIEDGKPVKSVEVSEADKKLLRGFRFLSDKPWVLVVSIPETGGDPKLAETIPGAFEARVAMRAKIESEVAELEPADRAAFMADLGIHELAAESLLHASFLAMGTISFFTSGEDEVRAWPIRRGANAEEAAGRIHSDLARGFIRAEVYSYDDFKAVGGEEAALKKLGKFRVEGREYVVRDGDIVNIRFSV
ncbi:MAG: DUF933 domain-containing protein [Planctomycetes bacterium]|nr:DUF933 domain-containing protein [Planctomycetota bacterium]